VTVIVTVIATVTVTVTVIVTVTVTLIVPVTAHVPVKAHDRYMIDYGFYICYSYDLWQSLRYGLLFNDILNIFGGDQQ
jgi:hypothetical protein